METDLKSTPADGSLLALAQSRFGALSTAETSMISAAPMGEGALCGPSYNDSDPENDPSKAKEAWGPERTIKAELIHWLCTNRVARDYVAPKGLRVYGAKIVGALDLAYVDVPFPLYLRRCCLTGNADLESAKIPLFSLRGSFVREVSAPNLEVKGSVCLMQGFHAEGEVCLVSAKIGCDLNCEDGTFTNPSGRALYANSIKVQGCVFLRNGFRAFGEVRLLDAQIDGTLECDQGIFNNPLVLVPGPGHTVKSAPGIALYADRIKVQGSVYLRNNVEAEGEVRLLDAQIEGTLECDQSTFKSKSGTAIYLDRIRVHGGVFLRNGFRAEGAVHMVGAQIGGNLDCSNGVFKNPAQTALVGDGVDVKGGVSLDGKFEAEGEVRLVGAHIGAILSCSGGTFHNPGGVALNAAGAEIKGDVVLGDSICTAGDTNLESARIDDYLDCRDGRFCKVRLATVSVKLDFWWQNIQGAPSLDLREANVGSLGDDESSWPAEGNLQCENFVYARISQGPTDAASRLRWLKRQTGFVPQPYRQLAKFLGNVGDDDGAKTVLYELERRKRETDRKRKARGSLRWIGIPSQWLERAWDAIFRATVGYGIYPERAIWGLFAMVFLGWIVYFQAQRVGVMAPSDKEAYSAFQQDERQTPAGCEPFTPLIYSLENSVPLFKLGQDDHWQPDPNAKRHAPAASHRTGILGRIGAARDWLLDVLLPNWLSSPAFLRWFRWCTITMGWLLATFFVAAVTGITKTG
jgi:hypothetical protein